MFLYSLDKFGEIVCIYLIINDKMACNGVQGLSSELLWYQIGFYTH